MKNVPIKIYKHSYKLSVIKLYGIGTLFPLIFSTLIIILTILFPNIFTFDEADDLMVKIKGNPLLYLISIIILAPFLETLIQYGPIKLATLLYSNKNNKYIICSSIILSALIFSILHGKELIFTIPLFFAGFIWAYICFILIRKKSAAYLTIIITHSSYNMVLLFLDYIFY